MFDIRIEGKQPIYEQLCAGIEQLIISGVLKADEKLPTVRETAKALGINPNTVQKAYARLEQDGMIYSVPAKGSYVSSGQKAHDAITEKALSKLKDDMLAAKKAGVSAEDAASALEEVWDKKGNE